jgi:hypothetical protein
MLRRGNLLRYSTLFPPILTAPTCSMCSIDTSNLEFTIPKNNGLHTTTNTTNMQVGHFWVAQT